MMKKVIILYSCCLMMLALCYQCRQPKAFTGEVYSTDRIDDVSGEQIPILGWYGIPSGKGSKERYQEMKSAGFTHNLPSETPASHEDNTVIAELDAAHAAGMKMLIYADMMDHSTSFVKKLKEHPANGGYIVRDEPSNRDFPALAATVRKIQALDNEHPCYINLFTYGGAGEFYGIDTPDDFREFYLRPFIREVPVPMISFDDYPVYDQDGKRTIRAGKRTAEGGPGVHGWYGALAMFAEESRKADKPLWAFALATAHIFGKDDHPIPTIDDLRLQVYSNLAYGVQCIQYFTYWTPPEEIFHDGPIGKDGQKTGTYDVVQAMNKEIIALSPVFLHAKVAWAAHTGEIPDALCAELKKEQLPEVIQSLDITGGKGALVSLLEKGDDRFLVIVNHDLNADIQVQVKGKAGLRRVMKDGSIVIPDHRVWTVTPGDALIYFWKTKPVPEQVISSEGVRHPGRKWTQKEFFLSTFSAIPEESANYQKVIATLKEAGFNYIETAWLPAHITEAILQECDRQGLKVMAQDLGILGGFQDEIRPFHRDSVEKYLHQYGAHPSLQSVYICDEPIAGNNEIVRKNIDEFEQVRPDLLGFVVLLPSYYPPYDWTDYTQMRYDEYVDRYIAEVNPVVLSTDYYPFQTETDTTVNAFCKSLFWKDMGLFRDRALRHDLIHWFYYQTVAVNSSQPAIHPGQVAVQAWAAVMYGVKGLSTYMALNAVVDKNGDKDCLFDTQKKVNKEISALGNTLLHLKSTAVYHAEMQIPDTYAHRPEESVWLAGLPEHVSAGEFADSENNAYILFLNKDFTADHEFTIPLKGMFRIYACDKHNNGKQSVLHDATNSLSLNLQAGEGVLTRIEPANFPKKRITYTIK